MNVPHYYKIKRKTKTYLFIQPGSALLSTVDSKNYSTVDWDSQRGLKNDFISSIVNRS